MPHPSHPLWFDCPNNIWWRVQTAELLVIQFSPAFRHFISLRSKFSYTTCSQTSLISALPLSWEAIGILSHYIQDKNDD
jgi:hypothetical protein